MKTRIQNLLRRSSRCESAHAKPKWSGLTSTATRLLTWALLALLSTINLQLSTARAQGTAFTYQGRLNDGPNPANGTYDFQFQLATDPFGGGYAAFPFATNIDARLANLERTAAGLSEKSGDSLAAIPTPMDAQ